MYHCFVGGKDGLAQTPCVHMVLFQVRVVVPYLGPSSDYVVVRMIPDNRLPPRHLHAVHTGKTSAVIKWESPYDSPDQDLVSGPGIRPAVCALGMVWEHRGGPVAGQEIGPVAGAQQGVSPPPPRFSRHSRGPCRCLFLTIASSRFPAAILVCLFFFSAFSPSLP